MESVAYTTLDFANAFTSPAEAIQAWEALEKESPGVWQAEEGQSFMENVLCR